MKNQPNTLTILIILVILFLIFRKKSEAETEEPTGAASNWLSPSMVNRPSVVDPASLSVPTLLNSGVIYTPSNNASTNNPEGFDVTKTGDISKFGRAWKDQIRASNGAAGGGGVFGPTYRRQKNMFGSKSSNTGNTANTGNLANVSNTRSGTIGVNKVDSKTGDIGQGGGNASGGNIGNLGF